MGDGLGDEDTVGGGPASEVKIELEVGAGGGGNGLGDEEDRVGGEFPPSEVTTKLGLDVGVGGFGSGEAVGTPVELVLTTVEPRLGAEFIPS